MKNHAQHWEQLKKKTRDQWSSAHVHDEHTAWLPNADVFETEKSLSVKVELAGIRKENINVVLNDRILVISGHRIDDCRNGKCSFRQMEIDYGYFERKIIIPKSVDTKKVRAQYSNGFLIIDLPKSTRSGHSSITIIVEQ